MAAMTSFRNNARPRFCDITRVVCNALYGASLKTITDKLQRVLNAATRVVSDTRKFDRGLSALLHDELHWLDVPERITYIQAGRDGLHGQAPYLADHLTPASDVVSRLRLRSANRQQLLIYLAADSTRIRRSGFRNCWSDCLELVT